MKLKLILLTLFLLVFSGCSTTTINTNPINSVGEAILVEDYYAGCVENSHGDTCYVVQKFGHSDVVGTTITPISEGLIYRTPSTLTSLEILSSSAADNIAGAGARSVKVTGLSTDWERVEEIVNLTGTTPVALSNQYYRIYRAGVETSGTYANETAASHQGTITIRETGAGQIWTLISITPMPLSTTEIGVYTIPKGYSGYLLSAEMFVDGNKAGNLYLFKRESANDVTAPYTPMKLLYQFHGVVGEESIYPRSKINSLPEMTDIGFMGNTDTGTTGIGVHFELLLVKN